MSALRYSELVAGGCFQRRPFFEDRVGIAPAKSKRADTGQPLALAHGPVRQAGGYFDRRGPVNVRAGLPEVQMRRNGLVLQSETNLDHAGNPRGAFEMADV